jgi:hypothetical protein
VPRRRRLADALPHLVEASAQENGNSSASASSPSTEGRE